MTEEVRIVNALWQMSATDRINILALFHMIKREGASVVQQRRHQANVKYYSGRPHMTRWQLSGLTILFFSGGAIQMMGKLATQSLVQRMRKTVLWMLTSKMQMVVDISQPVLKNMVVYCKYMKPFRLRGRPSNAHYFYEAELFPAALIRRWAPAHIALFPSGSLLCTGIKSWYSFQQIIIDLHTFLGGGGGNGEE